MSRWFLCYTGTMNKRKGIRNTLKELFSNLSRPYARDKGSEKQPENYLQHLCNDVLEIEIGYNLVLLVDKGAGGTLLDKVSQLRKGFIIKSGLLVPPVRVRDNMNLEPNEYRIYLHGSQIGRATLDPKKLLAIDTGQARQGFRGEPFTEPVYNLKAYWIKPEQKGDAEISGFDIVDSATVIATHLSNIIQQNSAEIMRRGEIKRILDRLREEEPILIDEVLIEKKISLAKIQSVLQNLLREGLSIRNMGCILESISDNIEATQGDPHLLGEAVRQKLKRQIVEDLLLGNKKEAIYHNSEHQIVKNLFLGNKKELLCITMEPQTEGRLRENIQRDPEEGFVTVVDSVFQVLLRGSLIAEFQKANKEGYTPVFLCSVAARPSLFQILQRILPASSFSVLSHKEIPPDICIKILGQVRVRTPTPTQ